jgi:hypothetical protein
MTNAQYRISKTGNNFTVTLNDDVVATKRTKKQAQAWIDDQFTAQAEPADETPATTQEPTEMTEQTTEDTPVTEDTEVATEVEATEAAPEVEATEADPVKVARSQKLRDAMNAVIAKVKAGEYNPAESHPSLLTKRNVGVQFEGADDLVDGPAVLHSRTIDSFSDKNRVEGVTLDGEPVEAARTKGTWAGITRSFLWIEAPALAFPPSMVGNTKRATVTFHILVDNEQFDNLDGAAVVTTPDPEVAAPAAAPVATPEVAQAAKEAGVKPAKRGGKKAQAAEAAE